MVKETKVDIYDAEVGLRDAIIEYDLVLAEVLDPQLEHQRNCQLHREEEINLYYQCTQGDINNYALHHFGGEKRSYPRWVEEYNVCIDHIHSAKTLHLDFYHEDGTVTLEPCNPQEHSSSVYIGTAGFGESVGGGMVVVTAEPLNPYKPCETQHVPDMSGIWVNVHDTEEAMAILKGNLHVQETDESCISVKPDYMHIGAQMTLNIAGIVTL